MSSKLSSSAPAGLIQRRPWLVLAVAAVAGALIMQWTNGAQARITPGQSVSLEQARADHEAGRVVLIDIREPHEHAGGVVPGAQRLPSSQWAQRWQDIPADASRPVYLICATQNRSRAAWERLQAQPGYEHVRYVVGGMSAWKAQGWPTISPSPVDR